MSDDVIDGSDLLKRHIQMIRQRASEKMREAVQSEAETRGIDLDEYDFNAQVGAFVPRSRSGDQPDT